MLSLFTHSRHSKINISESGLSDWITPWTCFTLVSPPMIGLPTMGVNIRCEWGLCKANLLTFPQALQWWRLQVRVNSQVQIMHMVALRSGIHIGALDPSWAPLSGKSWDVWKILICWPQNCAHEALWWSLWFNLISVSGFTVSGFLTEMKLVSFLV